jgi:hypothetical protein
MLISVSWSHFQHNVILLHSLTCWEVLFLIIVLTLSLIRESCWHIDVITGKAFTMMMFVKVWVHFTDKNFTDDPSHRTQFHRQKISPTEIFTDGKFQVNSGNLILFIFVNCCVWRPFIDMHINKTSVCRESFLLAIVE